MRRQHSAAGYFYYFEVEMVYFFGEATVCSPLHFKLVAQVLVLFDQPDDGPLVWRELLSQPIDQEFLHCGTVLACG